MGLSILYDYVGLSKRSVNGNFTIVFKAVAKRSFFALYLDIAAASLQRPAADQGDCAYAEKKDEAV